MPFFVLVRKLEARGGANNRIAYRGLDRFPWACVDDIYYEGGMACELVPVWKRAQEHHAGNLSFGSVDSISEALVLASACNDWSEHYEILEGECLGRLSDAQLGAEASEDWFGYDCYLDGTGSLISLGICEMPQLFSSHVLHLTEAGLFGNVSSLMAYCASYFQLKDESIEPVSCGEEIFVYRLRLANVETVESGSRGHGKPGSGL